MAHLHSVYDTDAHFQIDPITRKITNMTERKKIVQYDHNSERFTFQLPRYIDEHDMSLCDKVEIHYINVSADKTRQEKDVYVVDDLRLSPNDQNIVILSWLISYNATQYAGTLNFLIRFVCTDGDNAGYVWNTEIFSGFIVAEGMDNGEAVIAEYSDVLEAWKNEVLADTRALLESGKADIEAIAEKVNSDLTATAEETKAEMTELLTATEDNASAAATSASEASNQRAAAESAASAAQAAAQSAAEAAESAEKATTGFITEETDPTVPAWAKAEEKPSYTAEEVGAAEKEHTHEAKDISGLDEAVKTKADKVENATAGNFAGLDADGNLTDSGKKAADFIEKLKAATAGNLAALTADGGLADSGATVEGIISQAVAAGLKVETGSYTGEYSGNGSEYGESYGKTLTFNGKPLLVIIQTSATTISSGAYIAHALFLRGVTSWAVSNIYGGDSNKATIEWGDNTVKWWYPNTLSSGGANGKTYQLNDGRYTYTYLAITQ